MSDADTRTSVGRLARKVFEYETIVKQLVAKAKRPGYSRNDWAPLTALVAVDEFERIGIWRERMTWDQYLDFMVPWAQSKDFDTRLRRITEAGNVVFFEIEERHIKDVEVTVIHSMNVYEFDERGKIRHLDVYIQGQLGAAAFRSAGGAEPCDPASGTSR
jgi:hypothetical protein